MPDLERKISSSHVGPGGMKCHCCGPAPGEERKRFRRRIKRGPVKEFGRREMRDQLKEME